MRILLAFSAMAIVVAAALAWFVYAGIYNVAATRQHLAPTHWLLDIGMRQSVKRRARNIVVPPLNNPAQIARGRTLYDVNCVRCHGAPGVAPESFAMGLTPLPANLAHTAREWTPAELFWVAKYGIKMAGMPAWEFRMNDRDLWAIVAYMLVMTHQTPEQYRSQAPEGRPALPAAEATSAQATTAVSTARGKIAAQQYACVTCHRIPGIVGAHAPVGPTLEGIATRGVIAGMLPNTADNMVRWLRAPQRVHPGNAMPDLGVNERDARDIAAYLYTLK